MSTKYTYNSRFWRVWHNHAQRGGKETHDISFTFARICRCKSASQTFPFFLQEAGLGSVSPVMNLSSEGDWGGHLSSSTLLTSHMYAWPVQPATSPLLPHTLWVACFTILRFPQGRRRLSSYTPKSCKWNASECLQSLGLQHISHGITRGSRNTRHSTIDIRICAYSLMINHRGSRQRSICPASAAVLNVQYQVLFNCANIPITYFNHSILPHKRAIVTIHGQWAICTHL